MTQKKIYTNSVFLNTTYDYFNLLTKKVNVPSKKIEEVYSSKRGSSNK